MDRTLGPSDSPDRQTVHEQLGVCLREARQAQGLSLQDLSCKLRMGEEQLRALEAGDKSRLPEPVFVIAQARRVADALGIDITSLLAPLKQSSSLAPHPAAVVSAPRRRPLSVGGRPWRGRPRLAPVALLAALSGALVWAWPQLRQVSSALDHPPAQETAPSVKPRRAAGALKLTSAQPSWLEVRSRAGAVLFQGTFQGERHFPLTAGLLVKAGRPDLVRASVGDQPAQPLGPIERIRWVSFEAEHASAPAP